MGTTESGIWFPGKNELVAPFEVNFSAMASSIQSVFDSKYTMQYLPNSTGIKALKRGTPFYVESWNLSGIKTAAAGTDGYQMFYNGTTIGTYDFNGFSGGGLTPGAPEILISAPKVDNYSTPYRARCELTMTLAITGNCAGYIRLFAKSGLQRQIRWHSYNRTGLYNVVGSLEVNLPPGPAEFFIAGNSDPLSSTTTEILTVSSAITISV